MPLKAVPSQPMKTTVRFSRLGQRLEDVGVNGIGDAMGEYPVTLREGVLGVLPDGDGPVGRGERRFDDGLPLLEHSVEEMFDSLFEMHDRGDPETAGRDDLLPITGDDDLARGHRVTQGLAEGDLHEAGGEVEPVRPRKVRDDRHIRPEATRVVRVLEEDTGASARPRARHQVDDA